MLKQITIIIKVKITGSNGTIKWFVPYNQYCYESVVTSNISCSDCVLEVGQQITQCYRVVIDNEDFLIPKYYAVVEEHCRTEMEKDFFKLREKWWEQPEDWKKEFKNLTGIDVVANETSVHNGYDLWLKGQQKLGRQLPEGQTSDQ
jgi:hypothetical protein